MTCGSSPFIILFYAQSFVKVCFFGIWGDKKPILETNVNMKYTMTEETRNRLDEWVKENYVDIYENISTNICKHQMNEYSGDLTSHMIESLYNLKDEKITQLLDDDKVKWYTLVGAGIQLRSSTSPFYRIYRKEKMSSREDGDPNNATALSIFEKPYEEPYNDSLYECFQEEMNNLNFYQKQLINHKFIEGWSLDKIYKYYNISKRHIIKDINASIEQIRERCNNC